MLGGGIQMLLSVIIPVLNGEKYIRDCILSVMKQEIRNMEIIVVDAGSQDLTINIVNQLQTEDTRISILNSDKKSYGAQVNLGIQTAKGKYLAILEADDQVPPNSYQIMLDTITKYKVDIVKGNYKKFVTGSDGINICSPEEIFESNSEKYGSKVSAKTMTNILRNDRYLWRAIYDIDFIKNNNIRLNETPGAAFQDTGFLMQTLILAKEIIYLPDYVYLYRKDNEQSSVYNPNGLKYLADEFEFVDAFLESLDSEERMIYKPQFYLTLMDMIRTRSLLMSLSSKPIQIDDSVIKRLQNLLMKSENEGIMGQDCRFQKDLYEVSLFVRDAGLYLKYKREEMEAVKRDVHFFWNRLLPYKKINIWGYGKTGSMLRMLLSKRDLDKEIRWYDSNYETISDNICILNPALMEYYNDDETAYVICAEKYRYSIRETIHVSYGVPYRNIYFYTLGVNQCLLFM